MLQKNGDIMNLSAAEFQPVFPIETEYSELPVNHLLKPLKYDKSISNGRITFLIHVPDELHEINVLCLVDNKKYDLFFNVSGGTYKFTIPESSNLQKISILYYNRIIRSKEQVLHLI